MDADIAPLATSLTVTGENVARFLDEFTPGMAVLIDDEQMEFTTFDETTGVATLKRGVADTIPASHAAGATIWLIDDELGSDGQEYQAGETLYGKALTRTSTQVLPVEAATQVSIEVGQRVFRPYPPGDVRIEGFSIFEMPVSVFEEPVLTWTHRDRKLQADVLVGHGEGSIGPEPGTTYGVRVYAADGVTLLRDNDLGNVTTWTYTSALQVEDGSPDTAWIELESRRDGVSSFFPYRFNVILSDKVRRTEADDFRITEDGDVRLVED